jgi:hypothetical protein
MLPLAGVLLCAAAASATPVIDGDIATDGGGNYNEYDAVCWDDAGETQAWAQSGLDIETLQFSSDANDLYVGLTVTVPPVDFDGGPNSFMGQSWLYLQLSDDDSSHTPLYSMAITLHTDANYVRAGVVDLKTGLETIEVNDGNNFWCRVGNAVEFRVAHSLVNELSDTFQATVQLDDLGDQPDDQLQTPALPEPASAALLGLGGAVLASRRRRRR